MEWVCGVFSSELAASWVEAVGSILAVAVTARFYFADRAERKQNEMRARARSGWRQALVLAKFPKAAIQTLTRLDQFFCAETVLNSVPMEQKYWFYIPDVEEMVQSINDPAAFPRGVEDDLQRYIAGAKELNDLFAREIEDRPAQGRFLLDDAITIAPPKVKALLDTARRLSGGLETVLGTQG